MTATEKISRRVDKMGPGAVFTRADFLDLATTDNVGMVLSRLQSAGKIRRIGRGLYELPRTHPVLGKLSPRPEAIAEAASRRTGNRLLPSGAQAANLLQLSEQVPARVVYQTDGASKVIKEGHRTIEFQHRSPRRMAAAGRMSGLVLAAGREIGKANMTPEQVTALRKLLSRRDRRRLIEDLPLAPAWMHPHLRQIASLEQGHWAGPAEAHPTATWLHRQRKAPSPAPNRMTGRHSVLRGFTEWRPDTGA